MTEDIDDLFKTPVTGAANNDRSPTSGDVHLYLDPESAFERDPILYADCEGLDGGETKPQAKRMQARFGKASPEEVPEFGKQRPVTAAVTGNTKLGARENAVRNIYPRLLYTFSDVIVFVLKNARFGVYSWLVVECADSGRTFESTALKLLFEWASNSIEASVNQAVLPQLIVVLNDSEPTLDDGEWDVESATKRQMEYVKDAYMTKPLKEYYTKWASRGKMITSTEQLLKYYYASIRVVRVPRKGRNSLIKKQIDSLHREISDGCRRSFKAKWEARQYCTTDELNRYLQAGFDHFSSKPNEPFNFIDVSMKADPIPKGFAAHIGALALSSAQRGASGHVDDSTTVFEKLAQVVASSVILDYTRYKRPGMSTSILFCRD